MAEKNHRNSLQHIDGESIFPQSQQNRVHHLNLHCSEHYDQTEKATDNSRNASPEKIMQSDVCKDKQKDGNNPDKPFLKKGINMLFILSVDYPQRENDYCIIPPGGGTPPVK